MKLTYLIGALFFTSLWIGCAQQPTPKAPEPQVKPVISEPQVDKYDPSGYQAFPPGYGYLEDGEAIERAIAEGDQSAVRDHGWKLWAGIIQPAIDVAWPIWYTWPNTYDAFYNPPAAHKLGAGASGKEARERNMRSLIEHNKSHMAGFVDTLPVNLKTPYYPVPDRVRKEYPNSVSGNSIATGPHFMSNGDIMIPTESYTLGGYNWIVDNGFNKQGRLTQLFKDGVKSLNAPETYVVTKHMFWPVKANQACIIPVWNPDQMDFESADYQGYEVWESFTAIDLTGAHPVGSDVHGNYLYDVYTNSDMTEELGPIPATATVVSVEDFVHHQVTPEEWDSFTDDDKACISAACYWAYGQLFEPGDYLVSIAMHINTKEVETWALQSVWWTDQPGKSQYSRDKPDLPDAVGPWWHYDLVAEYGILDPKTGELPMAFNPYIEPVIHPLATNCRNCHMRAGWPTSKAVIPNADSASYQNPDCPDLLENLTPESECLQQYMQTDLQWVIPDHAQK